MTYAAYLTSEEKSGIRHEYLRGEVFAMSGGRPSRPLWRHRSSWYLQRRCGESRVASGAGDQAALESVGATLDVDALYANPIA